MTDTDPLAGENVVVNQPNTGRRFLQTVQSNETMPFQHGKQTGVLEVGQLRITSVNVRPNFTLADQSQPHSQHNPRYMDALVIQGRVTPEWVRIGYYDEDGEVQYHPAMAYAWFPSDLSKENAIPFHLHWNVWMRAGVHAPTHPELAVDTLDKYTREEIKPFLRELNSRGLSNVLLGSSQPRNNRSTTDFWRLAAPSQDQRQAGVNIDSLLLAINPNYHNGFGGTMNNPTAGGDWWSALDSVIQAAKEDYQLNPEGPVTIQPSLNGVSGRQQRGQDVARMPYYADLDTLTLADGEQYQLRPTPPEEIGDSAVLNRMFEDQKQMSGVGVQPAQPAAAAASVGDESSDHIDGLDKLPWDFTDQF